MQRLVEGEEAHVWHVRLDDAVHPESEQHSLSAEEMARAARVPEGALRARFCRVRRAVRSVLSQYAGIDPAALPIERETGGKPRLAMTGAPHFSLTHSGLLAAIVVAAAPAGIDFEHVRALRRARAAARVLHPDTLTAAAALPEAARAAALIDAWTLREAHVKAVGGGMFRTPDTLPFTPHVIDGVAHVKGRDGSEWSVQRWEPTPLVRATVVVQGRIERVVQLHWQSSNAEEQ